MGFVLDLYFLFVEKLQSLPGADAMAQYGHAQKVILVQATAMCVLFVGLGSELFSWDVNEVFNGFLDGIERDSMWVEGSERRIAHPYFQGGYP